MHVCVYVCGWQLNMIVVGGNDMVNTENKVQRHDTSHYHTFVDASGYVRFTILSNVHAY